MPNSRRRLFWSDEETRKLLVGYNRYYGSSSIFVDIERDLELGFKGVRTNINIKDRLRTLRENNMMTTFKTFVVLRNTEKIVYEPRLFIPEELLFTLLDDVESEDLVR